ncbi:hypothetical protein [Domibacillus iocasae]|uniref:DUF4367 domain-containing protein n=1 Tax=Domibacillus iocasae TaxID=1714016 RepID=A0A1E7DLE1_9BACI|nr:hypothetical protein [Domibacillus iocasae]OES43902.1 hypothetical protein BA724_12485 [Domibacillus iocasae]
MFFLKGHAISLIILILVSFPNAAAVESGTSLQKSYVDAGYVSVSEALQESSRHFKRDIHLPFQIPPIPFTHIFGRFHSASGEMNDEFEVEYINENLPENHFIIRVRPIEHQITFRENEIDHLIQLKNGTEAVYCFGNQFNMLAFEKNGWQYMLNIDKRAAVTANLDMLTAIADSIIETAE